MIGQIASGISLAFVTDYKLQMLARYFNSVSCAQMFAAGQMIRECSFCSPTKPAKSFTFVFFFFSVSSVRHYESTVHTISHADIRFILVGRWPNIGRDGRFHSFVAKSLLGH